MLDNVFGISKKTIEVLSRNLIAMDLANDKIFELYANPETSAPSERRQNAIKLLLRCKKMYEARANVRKILKLVIRKEREIDVWLHNLDKISLNLDSIVSSSHKDEQMVTPRNSAVNKSAGLPLKEHPRLREGLPFLRKLASMISIFLEENRIFKLRNAFVFKGRNY